MFRRSRAGEADRRDSRSIDGMTSQKADGVAHHKTMTDVQKTVLEAEALPWKGDADETDSVQSRQDRRDERQGRIVSFFSADDRVEVTPEEIVGMDSRSLRELKRQRANELRRAALDHPMPRVTTAQRRAVLAQMAHGLITGQDEDKFLLLIPSGLRERTAEEIFAGIVRDPRQVQILALAAGKNAQNWREVNAETVQQLLTEAQADGEDYRTPVGFMKLRRHFLHGIKAKSTPELYRGYVQSMNDLERAIYGERMEYFCDFELLRQEARQQDEKAPAPIEKIKHEDLSSDQRAEILSQVVIEGDAWIAGGLERHLSIHNLTKAKVAPMTQVTVGGVEIALSDIFQVSAGRSAVIAYVKTADGVKVRAYYRTLAQGFWRYLPDYIRRVDGQIDTYCIGYGEESVRLPLALQVTLAELELERGVRILEQGAEPEFMVGGTTYAYSSHREYQMQWSSGRMRGDYYQEVLREPLNQSFRLQRNGQKKAPYTLSVDEQRAPDFRQKVAQFTLETADAGMTRVECFRSRDGQYNWLFCRDTKGRAWIGGVEVLSPVTSTGLRRDYVIMGDLTTSLYEVSSQAGIYGDQNDTKGARQCMWKNYLSNVPLIQEYLKKR